MTGLALGTAPLGNLFDEVSDADAEATVAAAWDGGVRYFDTAPFYGHGLAERRLGAALAGRPRHEFVLSTKVGRLLRPASGSVKSTGYVGVDDVEPYFDFSGDGVRRSLDASLDRLGVDRIDVALVHDPDDHEPDAMDGAFPALLALRDEGVVRAVGCGMNQVAMPERFVRVFDLDCVLVAGRYTLLDQAAADRLLPLCAERGVGVILGGVFNSGILAAPDRAGAPFDYAAAAHDVVRRARRLGDTSGRHGVALGAAAVQFARSHPSVTTVLVGARSADEVTADIAFADTEIPTGLWDDLATELSQQTGDDHDGAVEPGRHGG